MAHRRATTPVQVVLCLPIQESPTGEKILLGLKQRGFGAGRIVAPGGKIEAGESPRGAAVRELAEETGLLAEPETLQAAARVYFRFPAQPAADMDCTIFLVPSFSGEPAASEELIPAWHPVGALPAQKMWEDSALWLGRLLAGERFDALVVLGADNESVARFSMIDWPEKRIPATPATEADFPDIT